MKKAGIILLLMALPLYGAQKRVTAQKNPYTNSLPMLQEIAELSPRDLNDLDLDEWKATNYALSSTRLWLNQLEERLSKRSGKPRSLRNQINNLWNQLENISNRLIPYFVRTLTAQMNKPGGKTEENKILFDAVQFYKPYMIDLRQLEDLGLCPVFVGLAGEPKYHRLFNPITIKPEEIALNAINELDQEVFQSQVQDAKRSKSSNLLRDYYTKPSKTLACYIKYKRPKEDKSVNKLYRTIIQLRSVNQSIGQFKERGTQHCSGLSIHNSLCIANYINSANTDFLKKIYSENDAIQFIDDYGCLQRIDKQTLDEKFLVKISDDLRSYFSVLESPRYLDESIWPFVDESLQKELERLKVAIKKGYQQPTFFHTFILGTGDEQELGTQAAQHWYSFSVIKNGSYVQYVLIDTAADYHLQEGSYELDRIKYFIDLLEDGSTTKTLMNAEQ